jgi:transposase
MGKTYSLDLRERVVAQVRVGHSRREVARRFGVSPSFVIKLMARVEKSGTCAPAKRGRPFGFGKLAAVKEALIARVEAEPDQTLSELAEWLAATHNVRVHLFSVCRVLRGAGFTYKKIAAGGGGWARQGPA